MSADLLTPTINVQAERAKLRRLRNEINDQVQQRLAYERKYSARGYLRVVYVNDDVSPPAPLGLDVPFIARK